MIKEYKGFMYDIMLRNVKFMFFFTFKNQVKWHFDFNIKYFKKKQAEHRVPSKQDLGMRFTFLLCVTTGPILFYTLFLKNHLEANVFRVKQTHYMKHAIVYSTILHRIYESYTVCPNPIRAFLFSIDTLFIWTLLFMVGKHI